MAGKGLFKPWNDPQGHFSADDEHLLHMMQLTGKIFEAGMLRVSAKAGEFFETNGKDPVSRVMLLRAFWYLLTHVEKLKRITGPIPQDQLTKAVHGYNKGESSNELDLSVTFIKRCLQLNPVGRASAAELLADPWLRT